MVVRFSDNGNANWTTKARSYSDFVLEYINEFKVEKPEDLHFFVTLADGADEINLDALFELNE